VNGHRTIRICLILMLQSFQTVSGAGIALLLPTIRPDLGLSFTEAGTLAAANIFSYALMQMPAGYLADRYGLERAFLIGSLGTTLLLLTFGLIGSFGQAVVNQTLAGVFHAFLFQAGLALLANLFGAERRATAMGLTLVGIFSGQLLINGLGPVLAQHFNWRFPFIAFGVAGLLSSLAYLRQCWKKCAAGRGRAFNGRAWNPSVISQLAGRRDETAPNGRWYALCRRSRSALGKRPHLLRSGIPLPSE
jgi:MFS family permease